MWFQNTRNYQNFISMFLLLSKCRPLIDYDNFKAHFDLLNSKETQRNIEVIPPIGIQ
jgi:hypothetical protein